MSQNNTHTNNGQNRYQNSGRGGRGRGPNGSDLGDSCNNCGHKSTTKYSFKGKVKDGPISELKITETGHRPCQFKNLWDVLPIFCADKNYGGLNEVLNTGRDKVEDNFMPAYFNANLWSITHQIQGATVTEGGGGGGPNCGLINRQTRHHLRIGGSDSCHKRKRTNKLLSEYKRNSKNKSQEYSKFVQDKKSLCTILYGKCSEATQTEFALPDNYTEDRDEGRLLAFIERLRAICFGGDDDGLSYPLYKQVVVIKSLNIYTDKEVMTPMVSKSKSRSSMRRLKR